MAKSDLIDTTLLDEFEAHQEAIWRRLGAPGAPRRISGAPAGGGYRLTAAVIDVLLCAVVSVTVARYAANQAWWLRSGFCVLLALIYLAAMTNILGQTVGKMIMGIRVVDANGYAPTVGQTLVREGVGKVLSAAPCLMGYFWVAVDGKRQGWHDKIADTVVVHGACDTPTGNTLRMRAGAWVAALGALIVGMFALAQSVPENQATDLASTTEEAQSGAEEMPLMDAVRHGDFTTVQQLLGRNVDPNCASLNGETPLLCAARLRQTGIVKTLLAHRASVNIANSDGDTPLMLAVRAHDMEMARAILAHNPKIDAQNRSGRTALMLAAEIDDPESVRLLLRHRPHVNLRDGPGLSALLLAVQGPVVDGASTPYATLDRMAETNCVVVAQALLEQRADVNATTRSGQSALLLAVRRDHPGLIKLLLAAGADPGLKNEQGETPLRCATWSVRPNADLCAGLLRKAGARE